MSADGPGEADLEVTLSNEQPLKVDAERLREVARRTAASEKAAGEVSITLVGRDRIRELNETYLGKPYPTDVLAFPIDDSPGPPGEGPPRMIGEVVVCPEVALAQAEGSLDSELELLVAHGVLHLLGYDHDTEAHARGMRAREQELTGRSGARA